LKTLLIIWYSRTGASEALARASAQAAEQEFLTQPGVAPQLLTDTRPPAYLVRCLRCDQVTPDVLLAAAALIFACPENLGSMAGAMKEFFDQHYYDALDRLNGRAFACMVSAGSDGQGAVRQIERIALGWRLVKVAPSLIVKVDAQRPEEILAPKKLRAEQLQVAEDLGRQLAAGLMLGIY
jgi:multimeric flavodoxin WrbA